jgi:hypothetical protein
MYIDEESREEYRKDDAHRSEVEADVKGESNKQRSWKIEISFIATFTQRFFGR